MRQLETIDTGTEGNRVCLELREAGTKDLFGLSTFHGFPDPRLWIQEYCGRLPDKSVLGVAVEDGKIAGTQTFIPYPVFIDGQVYLSGRSERTLIAKEYRGKGFFTRLADFAEKRAIERGMQLFWGSTTAKKAFQSIGFYCFGRHRQQMIAFVGVREAVKSLHLQRPNTRWANLRSILKQRDMDTVLNYMKFICIMFSPACLLLRIASLYPRIPHDFRITEHLNTYADMRNLYNRIRGQGHLISLCHDDSLMEWLGEKGNRRIEKYFCYRQETLLAYCYIDISHKSVASIVDFAASDALAFRYVLFSAFRLLAAKGIGFVRVACSIKNVQQKRLLVQFYRLGFVPFYRGGTFVVRPLAYKDLNVLHDIRNWYITDLWYLLYRNLDA